MDICLSPTVQPVLTPAGLFLSISILRGKMQAIYIVELQLNTLVGNQYYSNSLQYPALFKKLL